MLKKHGKTTFPMMFLRFPYDFLVIFYRRVTDAAASAALALRSSDAAAVLVDTESWRRVAWACAAGAPF